MSTPLYHFAPAEFFYEREPYRNISHPTRFISLGQVNNNIKQKFLYIVNIPEVIPLPPYMTPNPFDKPPAKHIIFENDTLEGS